MHHRAPTPPLFEGGADMETIRYIVNQAKKECFFEEESATEAMASLASRYARIRNPAIRHEAILNNVVCCLSLSRQVIERCTLPTSDRIIAGKEIRRMTQELVDAVKATLGENYASVECHEKHWDTDSSFEEIREAIRHHKLEIETAVSRLDLAQAVHPSTVYDHGKVLEMTIKDLFAIRDDSSLRLLYDLADTMPTYAVSVAKDLAIVRTMTTCTEVFKKIHD